MSWELGKGVAGGSSIGSTIPRAWFIITVDLEVTESVKAVPVESDGLKPKVSRWAFASSMVLSSVFSVLTDVKLVVRDARGSRSGSVVVVVQVVSEMERAGWSSTVSRNGFTDDFIGESTGDEAGTSGRGPCGDSC
eukprot:552665-Amorphochlora_amoeboformis.AAC.2